ncbi:MAG: hypothetical protein AB7F74_19760, partial [Parvibaculaceae bacterium]
MCAALLALALPASPRPSRQAMEVAGPVAVGHLTGAERLVFLVEEFLRVLDQPRGLSRTNILEAIESLVEEPVVIGKKGLDVLQHIGAKPFEVACAVMHAGIFGERYLPVITKPTGALFLLAGLDGPQSAGFLRAA